MGILSNRIGRESLVAGDHIYVWRPGYIYAHHGIYVGNDQAIHFTPGGGNDMRTGTMIDSFMSSSSNQTLCSNCQAETANAQQVKRHCLDCFLQGGELRRYEYGVSRAWYLTHRGGSCSVLASDENEIVIHRAVYLLHRGFRNYDLFTTNCEDFARYCKTGYLPTGVAESGQTGALFCFLSAAVVAVPMLAVGAAGGAVLGSVFSRVAYRVTMTTAAGLYVAANLVNEGSHHSLIMVDVVELAANIEAMSNI